MEADGLEDKGVSLFSVIFSAMVGVMLFAVLILKTMLIAIFGIKSTSKLKAKPVTVPAKTDNERRLNVSYEYQKQA